MNITEPRRKKTASILALAIALIALLTTWQFSPAEAQTSSQWATSGNNINNTNAGNVGIGTATPASRLHVSGGAVESQYSSAVNQGYGFFISRDSNHFVENAFFDGQWKAMRDGRAAVFQTNTPNGFAFYVRADDTARAAGAARSWSDLFVIKTNGNVGIGTTTPGSKLSIGSGTPAVMTLAGLNVALGGNSYVSASNGTVNTFLGADSSNYGIIGTLSNHALGLRANNALAVTVMPNGNVGIGTSVPTTRLQVAGTINATGDITADGSIAAKYQDVAEWVPAREHLKAGTVVVLDTEARNRVMASDEAYDTRVAGVVSEMPGLILGQAGEGKVKVATTGRVMVKADARRGPIRIGDLLVTGEMTGTAMKSEPVMVGGRRMHAPGTIIGKALEPLEKGTGEILVLLSLQ